MKLMPILWVGLGGALGSVARFLAHRYLQVVFFPSAFPWGTFIINFIGCLLIGVIFALSDKTSLISSQVKLFLTFGICGGFTTFSTFAFENVELLQKDLTIISLIYMAISVISGLTGVWIGISVKYLF